VRIKIVEVASLKITQPGITMLELQVGKKQEVLSAEDQEVAYGWTSLQNCNLPMWKRIFSGVKGAIGYIFVYALRDTDIQWFYNEITVPEMRM